MPKCGCNNNDCFCVVTAGDGITVTGSGASGNPYIVSDSEFFATLPRVFIRRAAVQSIASGVVTAVTWDSEDLDTHGFFTAPSTVATVPAGLAGLYVMLFNGSWVGGFSARSFVDMNMGGNLSRYSLGAISEDSWSGFTLSPMAVGNTFSAVVFQATGGPKDFTSALKIVRLGP